MLVSAVALLLIAYVVYCLYMRSVKKRCSCTTDLTGKTVIVTGSDKGEWICSAFLVAVKCTYEDLFYL